MTTEIKDGAFVQEDPWGDRFTVTRSTKRSVAFEILDGDTGETAFASLAYPDRLGLARYLLQDVAYSPKQTLGSFVEGISGGNTEADRTAYVDSFGEDWENTRDATDLRTWINHGDSSRVDGVWDERIKAYYKARGY